MQASSTRVVTFEMCGNDGLQARSSFKSQTGTCNYAGMDAAVNSCKTYVAAAMDFINANAYAGTKVKIVSNLYYPGYAADNVQSACKDATTGATVNLQDMFLPKLATMNYWMCEYARQKGFQCADNFAQYMGADYDSNGDGHGRLRRAALRRRRERGELRHPHHVDAALDDPRRQYALRVRRAAATTTSSPTTPTRPTPAAPSTPACSAAPPARAPHATPRSRAARARSGTSTATSAWAGRCRPATRRRPERSAGHRMDGPRRSGPTPTEPVDGGRTWRPSLGYLAIALVLVAGGLAYGLMSSPTPAPDRRRHRGTCSTAGRARAASTPAPVRLRPRRQPGLRRAGTRHGRGERHRCRRDAADIPHARSGRRSDA